MLGAKKIAKNKSKLEKSASPQSPKNEKFKAKKLRSPKHKIKKGQIVIYNAAGNPVASYTNNPSPKRYNSVEDKRYASMKSEKVGKGNFRVINPTREDAIQALNLQY